MVSIRHKTHDAHSTNEIASRVRLTLGNSRYPSFEAIEVVEDSGTVVLSGHLNSFYMKQIAQTIAATVDGVRRVDNQVEVQRETRI